jgi:predicted dehydrogenase
VRARIGHDGRRLPAWAHDRSRSGGGALLDNGVHLADLLAGFGVVSRRFTAQGSCSSEIVERGGGGRLRFVDGPEVALWASWRVRGDYLLVALDGDAGALWLSVGRTSSLEVRGRVERRAEWNGAPFGAWERDMDAFLDEVRGRAGDRSDGVAPLALVDALYRSAAARAPLVAELP